MKFDVVTDIAKIKDDMGKEALRFRKIINNETKKSGIALKNTIRDQIRGAGIKGNKLPNTIRSAFYSNPDETSLSPASFIYSRAPQIMMAIDRNDTIRAKRARFLAIPTELARRGGRTMSPRNFTLKTGIPLEFIPGKNGAGFLVAKQVRIKTGRRLGVAAPSATALRTGRGLSSAILYYLVPQVHLRKRIDPKTAAKEQFNKLQAGIDTALQGKSPA